LRGAQATRQPRITMNYHHTFHAGNFADVLKHLTLCLCLEKIQERGQPFFAIDTHCGIGKYDLTCNEANRTGEFREGILRLLSVSNPHPIFTNYINIVNRFNRFNEGKIKTYPGSPQIIKQFLREGDKGIFAELNPNDFQILRRNFAGDKRITTLRQDGYQLLKSNFPPEIKKGLVLIDPPFEKGNGRANDFDEIIKYLKEAHKRFSNGIYLVWYPIVSEHETTKFYQKIKDLKIPKILTAELIIDKNIRNGFKGCGMLIINPPDQLDEKLKIALPLILEYLGAKCGTTNLTHNS
jgi:23S rRNA (adenine2030-N6)-methyltransferase